MKLNTIVLLLCCIFSASLPADEPTPPPVMLATSFEAGMDITEYWISEKLDGVRGRWTGERLLTRGGHVIHTPAWFTEGWPAVPMDGELWIARGRFEEVSGIVRTREPEDDEWRQVRFMVFDLPEHGGVFEERVLRMRKLLDETGVPWLQAIRQFRTPDINELEWIFRQTVAAGGEGLMLHHRDAIYRAGRSEHLLKYKPYDDAEAKVVAHTTGKGKYAGMLGALVVERPDGLRFRVGSGFTDAERADPPAIGSWITYRYNGLTENGIPRFARFLRVRREMPPPDPK